MILVVEDHPYTREAMSRLLNLLGYEVVSVEAAAEALSLLQRQSPELIILDRMMPDMDGVELLKRLRQDRRLLHVPVIFYSALADDCEGEVESSLGAQAYVQKGTQWEALLNCVQKYVPPRGAPPNGLPPVTSEQSNERD